MDDCERMEVTEFDLARALPLNGADVFGAVTTELETPLALRVLLPFSALSFKNSRIRSALFNCKRQ
jgi:hypothetical protein